MKKTVKIGNTVIGGGNPVLVQSMLNAPSDDIEKNVEQAVLLEKVGCEIIRVAIPDMDAVKIIPAIKEKVNIPLVADIHFDYKLALESAYAGIDKIRINPGNIGSEENIRAVANICKLKKIPIRIGVNSGSIERDILKKYSKPTSDAMCESALYNAQLLEKFDFEDIVISIKSSDVKITVEAYKKINEICKYPLHIGVTESGTEKMGIVKSSIAIGSLLLDGIGDTIRVSLTSPVEKEVEAGFNILKALKMRSQGIDFITCPTCGRTRIDIITLANKAKERFKNIQKNLKIAIMGCVVNGPGEAKEADIGITGGDGIGIIFKKGKVLKHVKEEDLLEELAIEIEKF